jgi:ribonuclease D
MREAKLIQEPGELDAALFRLRSADRLALDTEFMRERTYHPQLCLVQVATGTDCLLIDPLAGLDLAPLHELLQERSRPKILHAARQDLEVLLLAGGRVPGPLFDTQVAAALLGYPAQVGYAELVARQLGHSIDKGQTRTDWSRRPLTAAQLAYAADDVRHLLVLHAELQAALAARGRAGWVEQETALDEDPSLYRTDPQLAWKRLKGLVRLHPHEQAAARGLAEWRERRAIESDKPRAWILADEALYAVATRGPDSIEALEALGKLPPGLVRKRGEELLAVLHDARERPPAPLAPPRKPTDAEQALAAALLKLVRDEAARLGIAPEILATRRDLEAIAFGSVDPEQSRLLQGWRGEVLGGKVRALTRPAAAALSRERER